ncbi:MAG: penicillin-binding protein 2 [Candidatus Komeilibacteria bacterium]
MAGDINDPFAVQIKGGKIKDRKVGSDNRFSSGDGFVMTDDNTSVQMGPVIESYYIRIALLLLFLAFFTLGLRIFYLQIIKGDEFRGLAEGNRIRLQRILPNRGIIYDANGQQLVRNVPSFSVQFVPADLTNDEDELKVLLEVIAHTTGKSIEDLTNIVKDSPEFSYLPTVLVENISYENAVDLRIQSTNWPGIHIVEIAKREYLQGPTFSHVLGYLGKITEKEAENLPEDYELIDYIGKTGIEKSYEKELRGVVGKKQIEVDNLGKETKILAEQESIKGDNLHLYIDAGLQTKLSETINKILQRQHLDKAAGVIINPKNGGIVSMVSFPEYDNNIFSTSLNQEQYEELFEGEDRPLFNRSISGQYPSGSIIKPLVASAALEEGIIDRNTSFLSNGGIYYDIWFFPDWKAGGHGQTNVIKAIAESVNTFFYIIGIEEYDGREGLGLDKMLNYMKAYGLSYTTGVDIKGEAAGFLPDRYWKWEERDEPWYPGDTMHLAIGQGDLLVTPIQMANYIAAIANGGTLFSPHLVKEIVDSESGAVIISTPQVLNENYISKASLDIVKEGMRAAVTSGSSVRIYTEDYTAAGKTGTAQVGGTAKPHSWFVGFAPYEDPEIAWAIIVENGVEATAAAVPIMDEVLDWYFAR